MEVLSPTLNFFVANHKILVKSLADYQAATAAAKAATTENLRSAQQSNADRAAANYSAAMQRLSAHIYLPDPPRPHLVYPPVFTDLMNAYRSLRGLRNRVPSSDLTSAHYSLIWDATARIVAEDRSLAQALRARKPDYAHQTFSSSLQLQAFGAPFKIDVSSGEVKLYFSKDFGPIKASWSGQAGGNSGINTLVVQDSQFKRIFAVGGKPIYLEIPVASVLATSGSVMTITLASPAPTVTNPWLKWNPLPRSQWPPYGQRRNGG